MKHCWWYCTWGPLLLYSPLITPTKLPYHFILAFIWIKPTGNYTDPSFWLHTAKCLHNFRSRTEGSNVTDAKHCRPLPSALQFLSSNCATLQSHRGTNIKVLKNSASQGQQADVIIKMKYHLETHFLFECLHSQMEAQENVKNAVFLNSR